MWERTRGMLFCANCFFYQIFRFVLLYAPLSLMRDKFSMREWTNGHCTTPYAWVVKYYDFDQILYFGVPRLSCRQSRPNLACKNVHLHAIFHLYHFIMLPVRGTKPQIWPCFQLLTFCGGATCWCRDKVVCGCMTATNLYPMKPKLDGKVIGTNSAIQKWQTKNVELPPPSPATRKVPFPPYLASW